MPPKKKDPKAEKGMQKAAEKEKQKIVEDKTFGLKNKNKSKAVQKYIKTVQQQVKGPQKGGEQALIAKKKEEQEQKKRDAQQQALLASLFRGTENIKKIAVDGTSRAGTYDPKASKESQRIDLFTDQRVQRGTQSDTMEGWDQAQLEDVIRKKHVQHNERNATAIICKHFLEAVEKKQYGWFWTCPNGGDACIYRHCLPPGYVLKSDLPSEPEAEEEPVEVILERERAALPPGGTPVTLESFKAWKEKKENERLELVEAQRIAEAKKSGNKGLNVLSGKDLFQFDPSLFVDDEGAAGEADYEEDDEETREEIAKENQRILDEANKDALQRKADEEERGGDSSDEEEEEQEEQEEEERKRPEGDDGNSQEKREDDAAESRETKAPKSSVKTPRTTTTGVAAIREDLFLYGDDFDENELEELDD